MTNITVGGGREGEEREGGAGMEKEEDVKLQSREPKSNGVENSWRPPRFIDLRFHGTDFNSATGRSKLVPHIE